MALKMLYKILGYRKVYTGLRCWRMQHFERISNFDDKYVYDLANSDNVIENRDDYSPVYNFASFNDFTQFQYNDRFMLGLYKNLKNTNSDNWAELEFSFSDLPNLYDSQLIRYMVNKEYNTSVTPLDSDVIE